MTPGVQNYPVPTKNKRAIVPSVKADTLALVERNENTRHLFK